MKNIKKMFPFHYISNACLLIPQVVPRNDNVTLGRTLSIQLILKYSLVTMCQFYDPMIR